MGHSIIVHHEQQQRFAMQAAAAADFESNTVGRGVGLERIT